MLQLKSSQMLLRISTCYICLFINNFKMITMTSRMWESLQVVISVHSALKALWPMQITRSSTLTTAPNSPRSARSITRSWTSTRMLATSSPPTSWTCCASRAAPGLSRPRYLTYSIRGAKTIWKNKVLFFLYFNIIIYKNTTHLLKLSIFVKFIYY